MSRDRMNLHDKKVFFPLWWWRHGHPTTSRRRIFKRFLCVVFDAKLGCILDHYVRRYEQRNRYMVIATGDVTVLSHETSDIWRPFRNRLTSTNYQCSLVFEMIDTTDYNCYWKFFFLSFIFIANITFIHCYRTMVQDYSDRQRLGINQL